MDGVFVMLQVYGDELKVFFRAEGLYQEQTKVKHTSKNEDGK